MDIPAGKFGCGFWIRQLKSKQIIKNGSKTMGEYRMIHTIFLHKIRRYQMLNRDYIACPKESNVIVDCVCVCWFEFPAYNQFMNECWKILEIQLKFSKYHFENFKINFSKLNNYFR